MATIFSKLRTLLKANLHDLFDKALQKDDLSIYDEYIRQAEREVAEFVSALVPMKASVRETKRRREALATKAAQFDLAIGMIEAVAAQSPSYPQAVSINHEFD